MLERGADVNYPCQSNGWNALMFAYLGKREEVFSFLLLSAPFDNRPNLQHKSKDNRTIYEMMKKESEGSNYLSLLEIGEFSTNPED